MSGACMPITKRLTKAKKAIPSPNSPEYSAILIKKRRKRMAKNSAIIVNDFMAPPSGLGFEPLKDLLEQSVRFRSDYSNIILYRIAEGKINSSRMKISAGTI